MNYLKNTQSPRQIARNLQCKAKTKSGKQCASASVGKSGYCFYHDPKRTEDAKLAKLKGALSLKAMRLVLPPLDKCRELSVLDLRKLVSEIILGLAEGKIVSSDPLKHFVNAGNLLIQTTDKTEMKKQLDQLEAKINEVIKS